MLETQHLQVGTLAKESLAALNQLRGEQDEEKSWASSRPDALNESTDVYLRAQNNAWVVAKRWVLGYATL